MTPWTEVHQSPLSMGFSRQDHWSGLPLPPWDLPYPGTEPMSPVSPAFASRFFTTEPPEVPLLRFKLLCRFHWGFCGDATPGLVVNNPPAKARDSGSIPGLGRSPGEGNGNPLQYSCLEIPWTEDPGRPQCMELQKSNLTATANPMFTFEFAWAGSLSASKFLHIQKLGSAKQLYQIPWDSYDSRKIFVIRWWLQDFFKEFSIG